MGSPLAWSRAVRVKRGCRVPGPYGEGAWHTLHASSINGLRVQKLEGSPQKWGQAKGRIRVLQGPQRHHCAVLSHRAPVRDPGGSRRGLWKRGLRRALCQAAGRKLKKRGHPGRDPRDRGKLELRRWLGAEVTAPRPSSEGLPGCAGSPGWPSSDRLYVGLPAECELPASRALVCPPTNSCVSV